MPEEDPETLDLVLQYFYKLDYNDDRSTAADTRDSNADLSNEFLSGDRSPTSQASTSVAVYGESGFTYRDLESADDITQDPKAEDSMEVSVSPFTLRVYYYSPAQVSSCPSYACLISHLQRTQQMLMVKP